VNVNVVLYHQNATLQIVHIHEAVVHTNERVEREELTSALQPLLKPAGIVRFRDGSGV
jgi:hypothetical protein